jgi:hypothetical protein
MDTDLTKIARRNSIILAILLVIAIMALFSLLTFFPSHTIKTIFAIITITFAVVLPVHQKRFSLYSIFLVVSGILFLLSGVVDNAYHTVISPLPILQQIEFSKMMQPMQISRGLWHLAMGILYMLFSFAWLQTKEPPEKPKSKPLKISLLFMAVVGVLYSVLGITSIVEGLNKL